MSFTFWTCSDREGLTVMHSHSMSNYFSPKWPCLQFVQISSFTSHSVSMSIAFLCKFNPWVNTGLFPVEKRSFFYSFIRMEALKEAFALNSLTQVQYLLLACLDINWRYIKGMPENQFSKETVLSGAYLKILIVSA